MKAVVAAFNQEKTIVGAFSVITNLRMKIFEALLQTADTGAVCEEAAVRWGEVEQLQRYFRPADDYEYEC